MLNLAEHSRAEFGGYHLLELHVNIMVKVFELHIATAQTALAHVALEGESGIDNKQMCFFTFEHE